MLAGSTLFVDVCVQRDFCVGGPWPVLSDADVARIGGLYQLARDLGVRRGGVVCVHDPAGGEAVSGLPHCLRGHAGAERPEGCGPEPPWTCGVDPDASPLERGRATYLTTGCTTPIDAVPAAARTLDRLVAGIRDAVVFGAGVEYGLDLVVGALLRRRVRTHAVLDAIGAADACKAQRVVARWKRQGVDGATAAIVHHLLTRV